MPLALPFWRVAATFVAATRQKKWILGGTKSHQTTLLRKAERANCVSPNNDCHTWKPKAARF